MAVDSMAIADSKQVSSLLHKILQNHVSILIGFILFVWTKPTSITKCNLGYQVLVLFIFSIFF